MTLQTAFRNRVSRGLAVLLLLLTVACSATEIPERSIRFDARSDTAIVVLGSRSYWSEDFRDPDQSLTLHWQAFDPNSLRLLPGGKGFTSLTRGAVSLDRSDPFPAPRVLQVDPGSYALVAAGSGVSKSVFVPVQDRYKSKWGLKTVKDHLIDPLKYIDPQAPVAYGKNYLFSVKAGEIVYLGHFEFSRSSMFLSMFTAPRRIEDTAAARRALADYPGITGKMITLDPTKPPQTAVR